MSKKSHQDILGESHFPEELTALPDASNYGLNGFPDLGNASGSMQQFFERENGSGLPDGVEGVLANEDGFDLGDMMKEGGVQDLSWLEVSEQDLDRLPKNPHYNAVPELEEAWGLGRRTDGVHFRDLSKVKYEESLKEASAPKWKHDFKTLTRVVRKAARRSAARQNIDDILREAAETLEEDAVRIRPAMLKIKAEHGLAGNVFVRAAAYPGYEQGKWKELLRRTASKAKYIIVPKDWLEGKTHIMDGWDMAAGKQAVTEVPWDEALNHYGPILRAAGYKVASGGDPKEMLRAAFLSSPQALDKAAEFLPTHVTPSERISSEDAAKAVREAPRERRVYEARHEAKRAHKAVQRVQRWAAEGLLSSDMADTLIDKHADAHELTAEAMKVIVASKGASAFSGLENDVRPTPASIEEARAALASFEPPKPISLKERQAAAVRKRAQIRIVKWMKAGMISREDGIRLVKSSADPSDMLRAATSLITAHEAAEYSGEKNAALLAPEITPDEVWSELQAAEKRASSSQAKVDRTVKERREASTRAARQVEELKGRVAKIEKAIDKGVRGEALTRMIARTIPRKQARAAMRFLAPLLRKTGALEVSGEKAEYEGVAYRPVEQRVASVTPSQLEERGVIKWVRKAMSEGAAGRDLDWMIENRFTQALISRTASAVEKLREAHEGGAGFIYVDAEAYASPEGTKGCDQGALKHRANQVKNVLAMDRCQGCAFKVARSDGSPKCQKYSKTLITEGDFPETMGQFRQANIREANMSDAEALGELFSRPGYDPGEFNLQASEMMNVEIEPEYNTDKISEILFGGIIVDDT